MWYDTGTVAIQQGATTITGTGTTFVEDVRIGEAFISPTGSWHEITNVASNTSLSVKQPYTGAAVSGAKFLIVPVKGYNKELTDRVRDIIEANAVLFETYAKKGANSDITSLSGLRTALSLQQGGTGVLATTATDLIGALGLMPGAGGGYTPRFNNIRLTTATFAGLGDGTHIGWNNPGGVSGASSFVNNKGGGEGGFSFRSVNTDNTVGGPTTTLSYAGVLDVPYGLKLGGTDVVARGTSANGTFTKFADGTLICEFVSTIVVAASSANGASFVGAAQTMVFPIAFIEPPVVTPVLARSTATQGPAWAYLAAVDRSATQTAINIAATALNATGYCGYIAKGRWK